MADGKGKVLQTIIDISGEISPTLGKTLDGVSKKLEGVNGKAIAAGAAIGGIAAGTAVMVGKAVKSLVNLGSEFDNAFDSIRIGTGATGEALESLQEDFNEVYKSVPTTMEDASKAIADYNTRLGLSGEELQGLSVQAIQVSDMLDEDLNSVIEESSKAFQQWGIDSEDMGGSMDYIFKVSQSTGMGFSDLMSNMQSFGPQLQAMGYSFEEASALMGQMEKAGVNTEEVLGAMKKSVGALAKDGISATQVMSSYAEKIKNAGSEAQATAIANELFGARAGSTMAAAIRNGTLSIDELTQSLMENQETISGAAEDTYDFAETFQLLKQKAEVTLQPLANTIFNAFSQIAPIIGNVFEEIGPIIEDVTEQAMPFIEGFIGGLMEFLPKVMPMITELAGAILPLLSEFVFMLLPPLLDLVESLLPPIIQVVQALLPALSSILMAVLPIITELASVFLPIVANNLAGLITFLEPILLLVADLVGWIAKIVGWVGEGLTWVVDLIFGGDDVAEAAKVNGYATGGFTDGLSIAGEDPRYPTEAVISFNPAYRSQNLSYWARAGQMLGADIADYTLGSSSDGGSVNLGGITFAPNITITGNADKESIMEAIEEEYPEFIDMLESWFAKRGVTTND